MTFQLMCVHMVRGQFGLRTIRTWSIRTILHFLLVNSDLFTCQFGPRKIRSELTKSQIGLSSELTNGQVAIRSKLTKTQMELRSQLTNV